MPLVPGEIAGIGARRGCQISRKYRHPANYRARSKISAINRPHQAVAGIDATSTSRSRNLAAPASASRRGDREIAIGAMRRDSGRMSNQINVAVRRNERENRPSRILIKWRYRESRTHIDVSAIRPSLLMTSTCCS